MAINFPSALDRMIKKEAELDGLPKNCATTLESIVENTVDLFRSVAQKLTTESGYGQS